MLKSLVRIGILLAVLAGAPAVRAQIVPPPESLAVARNVVASPATSSESHEELTAVAWVQSSAEAKIAARQAYRLAARQLEMGLRDKNWSAALEQTAPFTKLPPAIILDLDETVLDNSPYFARLARDNDVYSDEGWNRWSAQADAAAIEGAVQFLQYAAAKGVQIFYVSNRTRDEEASTRANLQRLRCPLQGTEDHVLLIGEEDAIYGFNSEISRQEMLRLKYGVLQYRESTTLLPSSTKLPLHP